jgi:TRAP-type C4-dicarboxylate transport system permease small subunit
MEIFFLSIMTIMVFALVISRYLFSYSFAWVEALTRYCMIWMAFLGAAALFKKNDHIRMDLLYKKFPLFLRDSLDLLFSLAQIAFLVMLFKMGLAYTEFVSFIDSPTLNISMRWPTLIIPISSFLMIVFILYNVIHSIFRLAGKPIATK